ncbi:hypothetical protein Rvan_3638 [Rhodomicrobium vannielii ATCC 17100]|uniref:XRE family transcriptional regulator n=1 Tax=Rhodomicrobium vannielii (strain ATCC 17100 / DSM 162 / LMG 4299 / NCIMB 10020 / ATH 3.1.1) TaxID=648757 RepID=E3I5J2_RHOVT|nr:hypothetical protein [Rhodomicrobium vannielii]ADP72803.1 hypothetical protein Rvan_3638 [Rhodomicrobium vannielii ATCC 17100]
MPPEEVAERAGLPAEAGQDLAVTAIHLPLYRLCYVADVLDVSLDWLLGREPAARSEQPQQPQRQQARTAPRA